jgi:hypothetical protein
MAHIKAEDGLEITWGKCSALCSMGVILTAVMGFAGYLPGLRFLGSIRTNYIPMAPSTAVCFIIIGYILVAVNDNKLSVKKFKFFIFVAFLVSLFGGLDLVGYYTGTDLNFEERIVPWFGTLNGIPIARMSPSTGS